MLRLRSDELLVSMFRSGNEDAFRAIHDRYRPRMLAYTRQMLSGSPQDPEDAVQEVFVRAYAGLRASRRQLALRAWLYRIAHNRCIDELRRPHPPVLEAVEALMPALNDPVVKVEQRDSLRRLIADVQRLPEQQRSALLMRELGGMPYIDVAGALGVSVPAVKSLLVRARVGLAAASEARDTACAEIRDDLIASHDRGVRTSGLARRHMRDCPGCRAFRFEVRGVSREFAALAPSLGPIGVIANLLGWGGGGGAAAGGGAMAGSSAAAAGTTAASAGALAGAGHVVTVLAAALVATGGAVEIQHTLATPATHHAPAHRHAIRAAPTRAPVVDSDPAPAPISPALRSVPAPASASPGPPAFGTAPRAAAQSPVKPTGAGLGSASHASITIPSGRSPSLPVSQTLDPDMMYAQSTVSPTVTGTGSTTTGSPTTTNPGTGATTTPSSTGTGTTTPGMGTTGTGTPVTGTPGDTGTGTGGTTTGGPPTGGTPTGGTAGGTTAGGGTGGGTTTGGGTGTQTGPAPGTVPVTTGTASTGTPAGSSSTVATGSATHVTKLSGFAPRRKRSNRHR